MLKKGKKRIACLLLTLCLCVNMSLYAAPMTVQAAPEVTTPSYVVMEASTGQVICEQDADTRRSPASITKILTALLAIENSQMDEIVTFSYDSVHKTGGSGIARDVDEQMTMEQCLYGVMLASSNECA